MSIGIVLAEKAPQLGGLARSKGYETIVGPALPLAFEKTLFLAPDTDPPWDLLPTADHLLERWDAAVPLWRYGINASDVGTAAEREATEAIVRDLRVLLHAVELLFVKDNVGGRALIDAYREELVGGGNKRLAFLRAFYQTRPRLCVLPRSWTAPVVVRDKMDGRSTRRRGKRPTRKGLVTVEVSAGRFVKCNPGDEDRVLEMFERRRCNE